MPEQIKELDKKRLLAQGMKLLTLLVMLAAAFLLYRGRPTLALIVGVIALLCFFLAYWPERREYRRLWDRRYTENAYAPYLDAPTLEEKPPVSTEAFLALALFPCADVQKGFLLRNRVGGLKNGLGISITDISCPVNGANGKPRFLCGCCVSAALADPIPWRARCAGSAVMPQETYSAYYTDVCGLTFLPQESSGMPKGTSFYSNCGPLPEDIAAPIAALAEKCGGNAVFALEETALHVFLQRRFSLRPAPDQRVTREELEALSVPELPEILAIAQSVGSAALRFASRP